MANNQQRNAIFPLSKGSVSVCFPPDIDADDLETFSEYMAILIENERKRTGPPSTKEPRP